MNRHLKKLQIKYIKKNEIHIILGAEKMHKKIEIMIEQIINMEDRQRRSNLSFF